MSIPLYILATVAANLTAGIFILGGFVSIGTLFFGATFTLRDRIHRRGRRAVYATIGAALLVNVAVAAALGTPARIIAASFVSIALAEAADTEVYQRLLGRAWMVRVLGSNLVSAPLDSALFVLLAFGGVLPLAQALGLIVGDTLVKLVVGALVAIWRQRDAADSVVA